ncbi:MAG TPA: iron-containing alcohol dehydrogenase, partial [Ramlibacter sp.]|nr:iron-containing alcohol dehydrogenase [Ramlibacter sp.]
MNITGFSFPTAIRFGPGARREVADAMRARALQRPLLVTDAGLADLPVLEEFKALLAGFELATFAGVSGNPTGSQVLAAARVLRDHNADCVIGFGGGAALDVGKVVGVAATHEGDILEYASDHPAARAIERELPCFIALPTTAGTGSEVGRS